MNENVAVAERMAYRMRLKALQMAHEAGKNGAHLGGGLSCIEILAALYTFANVNPDNIKNREHDRILIGKAHCVLAYYAVLYEKGFLKDEDIGAFEQNGSDFPGHPLKNINYGIEYAGGSLGMALSVGIGMAYVAKQEKSNRRVYVLLGDGECEEGSVWEGVIFANHLGLNNLTVIVDRNQLQYDGTTEEIGGLTDFKKKFEIFGWNVEEIAGHDINALLGAFQNVDEIKPKMIIADTIKGKGVSFMENDKKWHHSILNDKQYEEAVAEVKKSYAGNQ